MKFSMSVKFVVALSVLMVMLAGSAWAGVGPSITIGATLDSTGKIMTFTRSYFMDGQPHEHYGSPLTAATRTRIGEDQLVKIAFRKKDSTGDFQTFISESPIKINLTNMQATFIFNSEL